MNRKTWDRVSLFVCLTPFMATVLEGLGIASDRIVLRPTPTNDPGPSAPPGEDVLFVGRLDASKGVLTLLEAWAAADPPRKLLIAGSGPLEHEVERKAAACSSVRFLGRLTRPEVAEQMRACGVVAIPSQWFEGYPRIISEAFAAGRAVIASDLGSLSSIVDSSVGWLAQPTVAGWRAALLQIPQDAVVARGRAARERYLRDSSTIASAHALIDIYKRAVDERRDRKVLESHELGHS